MGAGLTVEDKKHPSPVIKQTPGPLAETHLQVVQVQRFQARSQGRMTEAIVGTYMVPSNGLLSSVDMARTGTCWEGWPESSHVCHG